MTALSKFRRTQADPSSSYTGTGVRTTRDRILNLADVVNFNHQVEGCVGTPYERQFFGMPLSKAIASGYQITARGYFDATESPIAIHTAKMLRRLSCAEPGHQELHLLDLFAGTGQTAWAFLQEGFHVESAELDPIRTLVAYQNLNRSGLAKRWTLNHEDAVSVLKTRIAAEMRFDAVYLDPPWAGRYDYDLHREFRLEDMAPSGMELLEMALRLSDVVGIKCPQTISLAQVELLCRELQLWGKLEYQEVAGFPRELNQATIYFVKRGRYPHLLNLSFGTVTLASDFSGGEN